MRGYRKLCVSVVIVFLLIIACANYALSRMPVRDGDRLYMVEINRAEDEIRREGETDPAGYRTLVNVTKLEKDASEDEAEDFFQSGGDYAVRIIDGAYYRFDYETDAGKEYASARLVMNSSLAVALLATIALMVWMRQKILLPFHKISSLPEQIAKGNLTGEIKESKSRYFGRFIWGLNILKENLEQSRAREMSILKERNTLILSLSHDIKTPLSAIKLYAKALEKNLYGDNANKKNEIVRKISENTDEINSYLADIIKANSEDFLNLKVQNNEFYLSYLIGEIQEYYREKLILLGTEFEVGEYHDCLLKGDSDRAVEVLQNIMENAIKYGDGENITVSVEEKEDLRLVTVTNTGTPVSPDEAAHIFSSFYRGSNIKNKPGSGLGLYICRKLMNMMDGEIYVKRLENGMSVTAGFRVQK